jgi:hypothetical protein
MCCVLFECGVLFCVLCVIVVPLPPGTNPFKVKINTTTTTTTTTTSNNNNNNCNNKLIKMFAERTGPDPSRLLLNINRQGKGT